MIVLLLLVIPVDATGGCCRNNYTACGKRLSFCEMPKIQDNALYRCTTDQDPVQVRICMTNCLQTQTRDDLCTKDISRGNSIPAGRSLLSGEYISTDTNRTQLILQDDGNLVLYRYDGSPYRPTARRAKLWASDTTTVSRNPQKAIALKIALNGYVSLRSQDNSSIWSLHEAENGPIPSRNSSLWVLDGNGGMLCLKVNDTCVWYSTPDFGTPDDDLDTSDNGEAGCCNDKFRYCGYNFHSCKNVTFNPAFLYQCKAFQNPKLLGDCFGGICLNGGSYEDDFCSRRVNGSFIPSKGVLLVNESVYSASGATRLTLQPNGSLMLYHVGDAGITTLIWFRNPGFLKQQPVAAYIRKSDGNVMLVNETGQGFWNLGIGKPEYVGSDLWVLDDLGGILCLRRYGSCLWQAPTQLFEQQQDAMTFSFLPTIERSISATAIVGLVVGSLLIVATAAAVLVYMYCRRRHRNWPQRSRWKSLDKAHPARGKQTRMDRFTFPSEFTDYVNLFEVPAKTLQIGSSFF